MAQSVVGGRDTGKNGKVKVLKGEEIPSDVIQKFSGIRPQKPTSDYFLGKNGQGRLNPGQVQLPERIRN